MVFYNKVDFKTKPSFILMELLHSQREREGHDYAQLWMISTNSTEEKQRDEEGYMWFASIYIGCKNNIS